MSTHRQIQTKIWCDKDVLAAPAQGKLLFLYLICNKHINNSGVYEMPLSTISHDLKIAVPTVTKLLGNGSIKNVHYDFDNEMVFVVNAYRKYHPGGNPVQVEKGIINEFNQTNKTPLWNLFLKVNPYFKDIFPTVDQRLPNRSIPIPIEVPLDSNKKNEGKFEPQILEIIAYLNDKADKDFKFIETNKVNIRARLGEKYTVDDCKLVVDNMVAKWKGDAKMNEYLRPITLFQPKKFDGYRNAKPQVEKEKETSGSAKRRQIERLLARKPVQEEQTKLMENGV